MYHPERARKTRDPFFALHSVPVAMAILSMVLLAFVVVALSAGAAAVAILPAVLAAVVALVRLLMNGT